MMRFFVFLLFINTLALAKSKESCYTIQLVSKYNSEKNLELLKSQSYPDNCRIMQIGKAVTVRCECFEEYSLVKETLPEYQKSYANAAIATTYKSRFDNKVKTSSSKRVSKVYTQVVNKSDEELRLLLQVFLYQGDLTSAYKVASRGYAEHPSSYYWNQKMFEVCKWTNRTARSMKHLRKMYDIKREENMERSLIEYGEKTYQYEDIEPLVVNRARANPSEKNIDLMIKVYRKLGYPEKVVAVLDEQYKQDPTNKVLLTKALTLSLDMGDLELASKYVALLEKEKPYSKRDATLIARYYYISHDIRRGYSALDHTKDSVNDAKEDHKKYYELKSDLGWYLQENEEAALASKHLIQHDESRLVDYERVAYVYQKSDPKLAAHATRMAYKKYQLSYLFYSYANSALNSEQYDSLNEMVKNIDENSSPLVQESLYWIIKSKIYAHYHKYKKEEYALSKAYALEPNNMQIKLELLWFYSDQNDIQNVKMILNDMAENPKLKSNLYFPMASAYYNINEIDRASYYVQKLIGLNDPTIHLVEFELLEAYIFQAQQNEYGFKTKMIAIEKRLRSQAKENPKLKKSDKYLSGYLRVAMYVLNPDKFEKKLKKAKLYLNQKNYDEISYSWAIRNSAREKSLKIYHRMDKKALWLRFSNALVFQEHTNIENILDIYLHIISVDDASVSAYSDGQIALSQSMSYKSMLNNEKSQSSYIQHLSLSRERSDELDVKTAYYFREPLLQEYVEVNNKTYIQDGYTFLSHLFYTHNKSTDEEIFTNVEKNTVKIGVGLRRLYNRGELEVMTQYHDEMKQYMELRLSGKYRASTDLTFSAKIGKNMDTLESTQLLLGGKKDAISADVAWKILNSTTIDFHTEYNEYASQDDVALGSGRYSRVLVSKQFRSGYPDLRAGAFYDRGLYNETSGSRGVIDKLTPTQYNVLPIDFYNIGMNISYGMANSSLYTRVWRPYIEFSPYYNSDLDDYTYGFNMGIGGKVLHQDHLSIGASYTDSVNGIGGKIWEIYLNYQFMYYHP